MLDKKLTIYKSLDLQKPAIPPRSHLYHLEPIGVGTPYVESLTGYIARLAEAHCISTGRLTAREFLQRVQEQDLFQKLESRSKGLIGTGSRALNGTGSRVAILVQALEALTLQSNLRSLTMLTWADVLLSHRLLRPFRAWCPYCYEEWREAGQVVYEPLIWALDVVTVCPNHTQCLQTQCFHCYQQLHLLSSRFRSGYCSECQEWLGISSTKELSDSSVLSEDGLKWQLWVIDNLGQLIATTPHFSSAPSRERLIKNLVTCVNQVTSGNLSQFNRLLGLPSRTLKAYYMGKHIPQPNTILKICYLLGISLLDFLTQKVITTNSSKFVIPLQEKQKPQPLKKYKKFNIGKAQKLLQTALQEFPPLSLKEIRRRLGGVSYGNLSYYFPDLCRAVSSRYADYKRTQRLEEVQRVLEAVLKSDEYPPLSINEVARRVGYSQNTLYSNFPDLCRAISARYTSYRKACAVEKIEQLRQQVRQAALEVHAKGINPHSGTVGNLSAGFLDSRGSYYNSRQDNKYPSFSVG